jgi:hypothetical protein
MTFYQLMFDNGDKIFPMERNYYTDMESVIGHAIRLILNAPSEAKWAGKSWHIKPCGSDIFEHQMFILERIKV